MTTDRFQIPACDVPVLAKPEVAVVGGGAAGLAAAVAVGRLGCSVLLIEKYGFCGGATVAGLSGTICGLYSSGEKPEQIVFGFAGEFHDRLKALGGIDGPVPFGRTMLVPHDSLVWKEVADALLEQAGVDVLYHANFVSAFQDNGRVTTLLLHCMEGLVAVQPRTVVDASGDALVVHSLNLASTFGKDGVVQTPTMIFRLGGVDMSTFLQIDPRDIDQAVTEADRAGRFALPRHHVYLFPMPGGHEVLCNMTRITFEDDSVPVGILSSDMSYAEAAGRRQARAYATFLKQEVGGFEESYMVETGTQVGIRQTRSIVGRKCLTNDDVIGACKFKGRVSHSAWPIEAHGASELKIVYLEDDHYDIPFETLIPEKAPDNLIAAGRCLAAEHEALASARVTAQCFGMGYGADAAAALMHREGIKAGNLTGVQVSDWMKGNHLNRSDES